MDVLSDVLKVVKLDGALFFHGEFSAPWCFESSQAAIALGREPGARGGRPPVRDHARHRRDAA